jgi:hypothetical protein
MSEVDHEVTINAYLAFREYTQGLVDQRRKEPTDDQLSVVTHAVIDGERLTDAEIIQDVLLIFIGGDATSRHTLTGGTAQLISTPDMHAALRADPDGLMANAVEEMLRWTSPVKNERGAVEMTTLTGDLSGVSFDSLLSEIRRRVLAANPDDAQSWPACWSSDDPAMGQPQNGEQSGDLSGRQILRPHPRHHPLQLPPQKWQYAVPARRRKVEPRGDAVAHLREFRVDHVPTP